MEIIISISVRRLKLKSPLCSAKRTTANSGRATGLYVKYARISPRSREIIALVLPQAGQSMCRKYFMGQPIGKIIYSTITTAAGICTAKNFRSVIFFICAPLR